MLTNPRYDVERMQRDMLAKGWQPVDLARRCKVSRSTVSRFLSGEFQTPRKAAKFSRALGQKPDHYLLPADDAIAGDDAAAQKVSA